MLARAKHKLFPKRSVPSTLLVVEHMAADDRKSYILHLVPEDGTTELVCISAFSSIPSLLPRNTPLSHFRAKQQVREQIGAVYLEGTYHAMDYLKDVEMRARELWKTSDTSGSGSSSELRADGAADEVQRARAALREAALAVLDGREEQVEDDWQAYPVVLLEVIRAKAGKVMPEPRCSYWLT